MQCNIKIAHIASSINTATDFHSRLELKIADTIRLEIEEDVQTTVIEVATSCSDVADEEEFFFIQTDGEDETEEQTLKLKEQSRKMRQLCSKRGTIPSDAKYQQKYEGRRKQYVILFQRNQSVCTQTTKARPPSSTKVFKTRILGQLHDEVLLTSDSCFRHKKANEDRITLRDGVLFEKYYPNSDTVKIPIRRQLVDEVIRGLRGEFRKRPGITETMNANRHKYYYPNMAQLIRKWVMSRHQGVKESRINNKLTHPLLQMTNERITRPEYSMQIDLVPELSWI